MIGRLQLTQEVTSEEENMAIVQLRQLRAQEAIIMIMKARKRLSNHELYKELVDLLRYQFMPSKRLIKEVIEWLIEHRYMQRDETDMNWPRLMSYFFSLSVLSILLFLSLFNLCILKAYFGQLRFGYSFPLLLLAAFLLSSLPELSESK
ncbi:unnamed protein product [Protopolystoma xenopodis]|uniref:Cullin neddylation domain-containing protein n=1 Tax=Protopolystoma xenopodis TaxID=117903 RepID=A0A448XB38_9PLAT|nr:unnamed protein product [Protopolystoma xenopodis]